MTPDGAWALVACQNQTPLPGGFDGCVAVYDLRNLPEMRWVSNTQIANTAWRTPRHIHVYSPNRAAVALRSANGVGIIQTPMTAPRYLPSLTQPADLPADPVNDWSAASLSLSAGDAVATWLNDADGANPLVQGTAGNRPTFRRLRAGGQPAVEFDGANDFMLTTDLNPASYDGPRSVVVVVSVDAVALNSDSNFGSPRILDSGVTNAAVQWLIACRNPQGTFNEIRFTCGGATISAVAVMPLGVPLVVILVVDGTDARLVVGGYGEATGTVGAHVPQGYAVGAKPTGLSPLDGLVYRVADWDRAFTLAEINHAGRHARVRYGAAWSDVG